MRRLHLSSFAAMAMALALSDAMVVQRSTNAVGRGVPNHHKRGGYSGAELRRLAAEPGVGSPKRIDPALRATFERSPR